LDGFDLSRFSIFFLLRRSHSRFDGGGRECQGHAMTDTLFHHALFRLEAERAHRLTIDLLAACDEARGSTPLFLKVAPDLDEAAIDGIARAAIDQRVDALIVANTTVSRPVLRSAARDETGGLSGAPLAALSRRRLADFRAATGGMLPLVSVGGIGDADEAYARIRAGASLIQLYTALVYEGPGLARRINKGLAERLRRDGFASLSEAIGAG
jgi:dihydroorotate dehydrogenase